MFYEVKGWWKSRTVWVGLITTIYSALALFGVIPPVGSEQLVEAIMGIVGILVVIFRVDATKAISANAIPVPESDLIK